MGRATKTPAGRNAAAARPYLLVGMIALVVLSGALYLSYSATNGLPWQSTYSLYVEVPNAQRLGHGDEVRVRGVPVGMVADVTAMPGKPGQLSYARLRLRMRAAAGAVPVDTTAQVRAASVLGASYLALTRGTSRRTIERGGTISLEQSSNTVDVTDLFEIFDRATARSMQKTIRGLGGGVAGRGGDLNTTFAAVSDMLPPLTRVSRVLAAPRSGLAHFVRGYQQFVHALAAVSPDLAAVISDGSTTLAQFAAERSALDRTIGMLPSTEIAVTSALTKLEPSLDGLASLADRLRPSSARIPRAVRAVNAALTAGPRPLKQLPGFSSRLRSLLGSVATITRRPATDGAIQKLIDTVRAAAPSLELAAPAQRYCNAITSFLKHWGDTGLGFGLTGGPSVAGLSTTTLGAEGEIFQQRDPASNLGVNYLPNENANECEAGNALHDGVHQQLGNPPGNQGRAHPVTTQPPGVEALAREAGLGGSR